MTSESAEALQQRLRDDLLSVAVPRHARWDPLGLLAVRSRLHERLAALGEVRQQEFSGGLDTGVNLILELPGREPQLPPLLVGAHYDGPLESPGADDNASGVVALLELARRWAIDPPRRPVMLVAFDLEEWGMLGGAALAAELRHRRQPLSLMVSLEMLAYTSDTQRYPQEAMGRLFGERGDYIALVINDGAAGLLPELLEGMGRHVRTQALPVADGGRDLPDVRLSDHSPFWDQGFDALMVTDTSFMRNPHYHRPSDTVDSLDLPFFAQVINGLDEALGSV
jgi:Zn-dependent M28 family amino/carboxypeptidase